MTPSRDTLAREIIHRQVLNYRDCERSLEIFVRSAWPLLEPGQKYLHNWTTVSICTHLEAVTRYRLGGEGIDRLIINIPPGCMKSTIVSVCWPVWHWLQKPDERFLTGSHNADGPGARDTRRARRLIQSKWFQTAWGDRFSFVGDVNRALRYENDKTGYRIAFGTRTGTSGERCGILILDDPNDIKKSMFSAAERAAVNDTYDQTLFRRLNRRGAIVGIQQRTHGDDWTGHVLKQGKWTHLVFPMEFEPSRRCETVLGIQDPRTEPGELLWPELQPKEVVEEARIPLGTYGVAGQFQQRPAPMKGGIVDIDHFRYFEREPKGDEVRRTVQVWDTAVRGNELTNCPWVCGTWVETKDGLFLLDVFRKWLDFPAGRTAVIALAERDCPNVVVVEDAGAGSGLVEDLKRDRRIPIKGIPPKRLGGGTSEESKGMRLAVEAPAIEAGRVFLPKSAPWLEAFLQEIALFPRGEYLDQGDMVSLALRYFREKRLGGGIRVI